MYAMDFSKARTVTTGAGNLTLSSVTGWPTFDEFPFFVDGVPFPYTLIDEDTGYPVESGIGELASSQTVLVRTTILVTWNGTVIDDDSPTAVNLTGAHEIICSNNANYSTKSIQYLPNAASKALVNIYGAATSSSDLSLTESTLYCLPWNHKWAVECDAFLLRANSVTARVRMGLYSWGG